MQPLRSFHFVPVASGCLKEEQKTDSTKEILNQEYIPNPYSQDGIVYASAQNLAIEAEQTRSEYKKSWSDAKAQIRAIFEKLEKKKKSDRDRRLRGDGL
ncbi:MAG: hypothetical protein QNJ41_29865 [Xenococcaceae cyanobacterium MO_188.B32]|nr:hypothetical protein [Xenococcaceae cyanobacterium MO_188.B32]